LRPAEKPMMPEVMAITPKGIERLSILSENDDGTDMGEMKWTPPLPGTAECVQVSGPARLGGDY
jgi:hypothetical protein